MGIADNLTHVRASVAAACAAAGRDPGSVRLLPVSKTQPAAVVAEAVAAGCRAFGENRVAEMAAKAAALGPGLAWVLIGHLQRNKAAVAARVMAELQSLDSLPLAETLQRTLEQGDTTLRVLVEVNTSGEASKHGLAPAEVLEFAAALRPFDRLRVGGLMTVAHPDLALARRGFAQLRGLRDELRQRDGGGWPDLSMGMSHDFEAAIAEGSTCVRVGTAIFGARLPPQEVLA